MTTINQREIDAGMDVALIRISLRSDLRKEIGSKLSKKLDPTLICSDPSYLCNVDFSSFLGSCRSPTDQPMINNTGHPRLYSQPGWVGGRENKPK